MSTLLPASALAADPLAQSPAATSPSKAKPESAPSIMSPEEPADPKEPKASKKKSKKDSLLESHETREQRVLPFVKEHQPELAKLLAHLKQHKPEQYRHALRDVAHAVNNLEQTKAKDQRLYELELRTWQAKSRIEMLVARSMVSENKELEAKLREALHEELKVKAELLAYKRDTAVAGYDRQIERLQKNSEQLVETRLKRLLSESRRDRPSKPKRAAKPE